MRTLSDAERRAWLRLARTSNVGPVTFAALIARFGSAFAALDAAARMAQRGGGRLEIPPENEIERELELLAKIGGRMIACIEPDFPRGLAAIDAPPPIIAALGHTALLGRDMVAIVGARNASALGRKFANRIAADLGRENLVVISGLARGIDAAAHEGALATGTVAVLAGGIDVIYPPEHAALYARIESEGAVVSEMPLGREPQARHFPRRNRIISGMARGVVVVEAAQGSGSLITANFALEQGREIFAVPGSPLDPRAAGANRLIREGATLTESAKDVMDGLRPMLGRAFREASEERDDALPDPASLDADAGPFRETVAGLLGPAPVEIDELVRQTGAAPAVILTVILELELAGRLTRHPGNRVSLA